MIVYCLRFVKVDLHSPLDKLSRQVYNYSMLSTSNQEINQMNPQKIEQLKEQMVELRDAYPHLDSYKSWVAAGKPKPVQLWPNDPTPSPTVDQNMLNILINEVPRPPRRKPTPSLNLVLARRAR